MGTSHLCVVDHGTVAAFRMAVIVFVGLAERKLTVFRDIWEVTGIGLPHPTEGIFLKSFPVPHVWISCRLQVIAFNETLDGTNTDRAGNKAVPDELFMNLCSIKTRELPFQAEMTAITITPSITAVLLRTLLPMQEQANQTHRQVRQAHRLMHSRQRDMP